MTSDHSGRGWMWTHNPDPLGSVIDEAAAIYANLETVMTDQPHEDYDADLEDDDLPVTNPGPNPYTEGTTPERDDAGRPTEGTW